MNKIMIVALCLLSGCVSMQRYKTDKQLSYDAGKAWGLVEGRYECREKTERLRILNHVDENGNLRTKVK